MKIKFLITLLLVLSICSNSYNSRSVVLLSEKIQSIIIDPGHGGIHPGTTWGKIKEKDITLEISLALGKLINKNHPSVNVIYTRKTDKTVTPGARARFANQNKSDLFLSIHVNAVANNCIHKGTLSLIMSKSNWAALSTSESDLDINSIVDMENLDAPEEEKVTDVENFSISEADTKFSEKIAKSIESKFANHTNRVSHGVRGRSDLIVLKKTKMPSVLTEIGFLCNTTDRDYMLSKIGKEKIVLSLYEALKPFFPTVSGITNYYKIQLAYSSQIVNTKIGMWKTVKNLDIVEVDGKYKYYSTKFISLESAQKEVKRLKRLGFIDCFIIKP